MEEQELILLVKTRAGLRTASEAKRALGATLGALRCALEDDDARAAAKALPLRLGRMLERRPATAVRSAEALYAEAERREGAGFGFAVEHVQAVLQVLAHELDPELVGRIRKRLPSDIAALLRERGSAGEAPHVHTHPERRTAPPQTLSRARPGMAEPIAEARHELAHAKSVVRTETPHAERMVETARSTRPGREDETLSAGRPGGKR